jgi:hypothetical protein
MEGFNPKWCKWIQEFISRGSVGIRVNEDIGYYFQTRKGLRQGNPLSSVLLNIVADMLAIMINRAKEDGTFPFKYLGIPIHFRKLKNGEWKPAEDRFETKLSSWIGKLVSYGD